MDSEGNITPINYGDTIKTSGTSGGVVHLDAEGNQVFDVLQPNSNLNTFESNMGEGQSLKLININSWGGGHFYRHVTPAGVWAMDSVFVSTKVGLLITNCENFQVNTLFIKEGCVTVKSAGTLTSNIIMGTSEYKDNATAHASSSYAALRINAEVTISGDVTAFEDSSIWYVNNCEITVNVTSSDRFSI